MSERLARMRRNPRGDWTMDDVAAVCREFAVFCEPSRGGGSHWKIAHPAARAKLTIPFKRPIKPVYIRHRVAFIDGLRDVR